MVLDWRRQRHPLASRTFSYNAPGWDKWKIMPWQITFSKYLLRTLCCTQPSLEESLSREVEGDHSTNLTHPRSSLYLLSQITYSARTSALSQPPHRGNYNLVLSGISTYPSKPSTNSMIRVKSWGSSLCSWWFQTLLNNNFLWSLWPIENFFYPYVGPVDSKDSIANVYAQTQFYEFKDVPGTRASLIERSKKPAL